MSVTIKDIAKEADVSVATVSKVINKKIHVSPATQKKVENVIAQAKQFFMQTIFVRDFLIKTLICSTLFAG